MKEQDAAHSFEETLQDVELKGNFYAMEYAPFMMKVFEKFSLYTPHETTATGGTELTRLRSELQDTKSYYEDKLDARQRIIDRQFSELQQERELRKELVEVVENYVDLGKLAWPERIESLIKKARLNN